MIFDPVTYRRKRNKKRQCRKNDKAPSKNITFYFDVVKLSVALKRGLCITKNTSLSLQMMFFQSLGNLCPSIRVGCTGKWKVVDAKRCSEAALSFMFWSFPTEIEVLK